MNILKYSILGLSIGLSIASCNNCTTKDTTKADSTTTMSGSGAAMPAATVADTTSSASASTGNTTTATNASTGNANATGGANRGSSRSGKTTDSVDYSNYTKKTKSKNATTTQVNNPPKGTFGNSVGQDN